MIVSYVFFSQRILSIATTAVVNNTPKDASGQFPLAANIKCILFYWASDFHYGIRE